MTSDEQFEAWFASKFPKINEKASDPTDPVRGQVKEVARYAWKYSREAIEIELPKLDKTREQFETWASEKGFILDCLFFQEGNNYEDPNTRLAFEIWQDSRALIEIDLSEALNTAQTEYESELTVYGQCVEAIGAAGLKVKPC